MSTKLYTFFYAKQRICKNMLTSCLQSDMITNVDRKSTESQGENMTDTFLLESKIRALGLTISMVAEKLGITRAGFYKKLNNNSEFKASEISKLSTILDLSDNEREKIFFAQFVDR